MIDSRITKLADVLVNYSTNIQKGEHVIIDCDGKYISIVKELIKAIQKCGGHPHVILRDLSVTRQILMEGSEEQLKVWAENEKFQIERSQAYILIVGGQNLKELSDVPPEMKKLYDTVYKKVVGSQRAKTKWVVIRYPSPSIAQLSNMSTEGFEDYFFKVCTMDYSKMGIAMDPLKELMEKTDRVTITGPNTNLSFSIKGIGVCKADGHVNIPDGEVYSAPVKDSVNGIVTYNTPIPYLGFTFEGIKLEFKDGKVIYATANDSAKLNAILDSDEGSRYIGEFAFGLNPYITNPIGDILFDEKVGGSFHLALGNCYDNAYNGNKSSIHWDMVMLQNSQFGGGEIWFDDKLVRKDGRFILPELEGLNPENLK